MKRGFIPVIAVLLAVLILLSGCGSAKNSYDTSAASEVYCTSESSGASFSVAPEEEAMDPESPNGSTISDSVRNSDAKLIYEANISLQTQSFDSAASAIETLVSSFGGYIENSQIYAGSYDNGSGKSAYYVARIPGEKFDEFLNSVGSCDGIYVSSISKSATDIGAEYYDTESRLKTLRIKQERLQSLLEKAASMEDIISLENALSDVEYQIENHSSTLNRYDDLVDFSKVYIDIQQVVRVTENSEDAGFISRVGASFKNGIRSFASFMEDFAVWLSGALIPIVIIAAVVVAVVLTTKHRKRKKAAITEIIPEGQKDE